MSYPPAPGTGTGASSLPPRPPPSIHQPPAPISTTVSKPAATAATSSTPSQFSGFRPRQVVSAAPAALGTTGSYPGAPGTSQQPALRYSATYAGTGPQVQHNAAAPGTSAYGAQKQPSAAYQKQPHLSYSHTYAGAPTLNQDYQEQQQQQQQQPQQPQQQQAPQYHAQQQHQEHRQNQQYQQHHHQQQPQQQQQHQGYQQSGYGGASAGGGYNNGGGHQGYEDRHRGGGGGGGYNRHNQYGSGLDPELEAQIAEQQSIYDPAKRAALAAAQAAAAAYGPTPGATGQIGPQDPNALPPSSSYADGSADPTAAGAAGPKPKSNVTVKRSGGGQTWTDETLLEWNPAHFRLFVGNLAGEVTDDSLLKAFAAYPSVQKARVIRDKRTTKSKGYGFVAFEDGDDYFKAAKEMQGKYIGSHPVLLKKSTTEIKASSIGGKKNKKDKNKNKSGGGGAGGFGNGGGGGGGGALGKKGGDGVKKKDKGPKLLG